MATNSKKELKTHQKKYIDELLNYMKDVHEITNFLTTPKETMYKLIIEAIKKDGEEYSLSWKENKLYSLASYFEVSDIKTKQAYFIAKAHKLSKQIKGDEEKQHQTEKEKENYLNIFELRNIAEKYQNYKHIDDMYIYLIFSCLCEDQEALRPQIYVNVLYVDNAKDIKNDDKNYIYISKTGKSGYFYINDDKVSDHEEHKQKKRIRLNDDFLKIVKKTFDDYPRKKLFEFDVENPKQKLLYMLQKTTAEHKGKNNFNFQIARSSFTTHKYLENSNMSYIQKKTLAQNMRHTKQTQEKNYFKHSLATTNKTFSDLTEEATKELENLKKKELILNNKIAELTDINQNTKNYTEQNFNIIIDNKERTKILLQLQQIKATAEKYDEMINEITPIIDEYDSESDDNESDDVKKNDPKFNRKRRDIIRVNNARMLKSIENGDKKIKGQISPANMYKYDITFNKALNKYE
jgi:hypothetical protein